MASDRIGWDNLGKRTQNYWVLGVDNFVAVTAGGTYFFEEGLRCFYWVAAEVAAVGLGCFGWGTDCRCHCRTASDTRWTDRS